MTYVAFLRAINVGGTGLVKMADLQKAFKSAGCRNVRTFIASGNVVFDAPDGLDALRPRILSRVGALLTTEPVIVFKTARELETIVRTAPFGKLADDPAVMLSVAFIAGKAKRRPVFPMTLPKEALEAIGAKRGGVLVVSRRKPNGWYGFPAAWIEKELGVPVTVRKWSSLTRLVAFAGKKVPGPRA